jgi:hypothetical protein
MKTTIVVKITAGSTFVEVNKFGSDFIGQVALGVEKILQSLETLSFEDPF